MRCLPLEFKKCTKDLIFDSIRMCTVNQIKKYEQSFNGQPARRYKDGTLVWRDKAGFIHRGNNLPAIIHHNGNSEYWINGEKVDIEYFLSFLKRKA